MSEDLRIGDLHVPASAVDRAISLLERVSGPAVQTAELISDRIRAYRYSLAIDTLNRANDKIVNSKVEVSKISLKFLVPFLDGCSLEEDENLRDLWAGLLVSKIQGEVPEQADFMDILSKMTPEEAREFAKISARSNIDIPAVNKLGDRLFKRDFAGVDAIVLDLYRDFPDGEVGNFDISRHYERLLQHMYENDHVYFLGIGAGITTNDDKTKHLLKITEKQDVDLDSRNIDSLIRRDLVEYVSRGVEVSRFSFLSCISISLTRFGCRFLSAVRGGK